MMRAGPVSQAEYSLARLMANENNALEKRSILTAARQGLRIQSGVLNDYRNGINPMPRLRQEMYRTRQLVVQAMVAAHLRGRLREARQATKKLGKAAPPLALSNSAYADAIIYLKKRLSLTQDQLDELANLYNADALRVMDTTVAAVEKRMQKVVLQIVQDNMHVKQGVNELRKAFALEGITPTHSGTLETLFRTQVQTAYSAGRWNSDQDPAVQEILWGYKYVTAGDDRVRPEHAAMEGTTLPKDDGFWNSNFPPCGFNCRCIAISVFEKRKEVRPPPQVEIDGKMITPGADPGFRYNAGKVYRDALQLQEV